MEYKQEDKKKHLEFIQLAINRMASNSFILKGWNITLVVGLIALILKDLSSTYFYLAILPAFAFWGLDAYYLRQERLFRKLYDSVRDKGRRIEPYSLDTSFLEEDVESWFKTIFSPTIFWFHLITFGFVILFLLLIR